MKLSELATVLSKEPVTEQRGPQTVRVSCGITCTPRRRGEEVFLKTMRNPIRHPSCPDKISVVRMVKRDHLHHGEFLAWLKARCPEKLVIKGVRKRV